MTLQQIQQLVQKGHYAFYKHALTEADKEGKQPWQNEEI
jgi:hypothetical protein